MRAVPGFDLRLLAGSALLLLVAAMPVRADYKQDYARGKNAAADQDWNEVESRMRAAIEGSSTPLARTRLYGQRFEPYVPQYYLGLAAYRQGNCAEALRWFGDKAAAPIISENSEFSGLASQATQSCKASMATSKPVPASTDANKPVAGPATPPAKPVATADKPAVSNTPPPTQPLTPPADPTRPASPALPRVLQGLIEDYLAGRYSNAALADANTLSGAGRFHALLLRSASRHQLFLLQASDADNQRAAAEADIRLAKTLLPGKAPDSVFFSPRYRQFFNEVR